MFLAQTSCETLMSKISKQCVGSAALGLAQYRLSLMGWNVIPTSRNAMGADLYIADPNGVAHPVQVKGIKNNKDWINAGAAGKGVCKWWIIVRGIGSDKEEVFVQTEEEVIARKNKYGWSEPLPEALNAWHRIGFAPPREPSGAET